MVLICVNIFNQRVLKVTSMLVTKYDGDIKFWWRFGHFITNIHYLFKLRPAPTLKKMSPTSKFFQPHPKIVTNLSHQHQDVTLLSPFWTHVSNNFIFSGNTIVQHYAFEFVSTMIHVMPEEVRYFHFSGSAKIAQSNNAMIFNFRNQELLLIHSEVPESSIL